MCAQTAAKVLTFTSTGESSWGTSGAATKKLHGLTDASLSILEMVEAVPNVGWYGPGPVASEVAQAGEGNIEGVALYDDILYIMNGLFTYTSASTGNSTGGTTDPWFYSWNAPISSTQAVATYTLEYGTTGQAYTAIGAVLNGITLRGEAGGYWTYTCPVIAKQIKALSGGLTTAALVDRSADPVKMADTKLYMDAFSTGSMGATEIQASLISFELGFNANRHLKTFAGSLYPGNWGDGRMEGSLRTLLEFNTTQKALIDELIGTTGVQLQKQIRIQATKGSSAATRTLRINFAGIVAEPIKLWDDRDGNMTVDINWAGKYTTAASLVNWLTFVVESDSSTTT